jgi:putative spermidine/putrescine transport system ATP-binding protein
MELTLTGITKSYGPVRAVQPLTLTVASGTLVALLGPSGCGKTTTLRIIAGFEQADAGQVLIGSKDVSVLPPHKRRLGMVFQNYSLFPHMTVADNVAFGLRRAGCGRAEVATRCTQALEMVRLAKFGDRWPSQLSGGQQQRVALARSLVTNPSVLLLDEPLGALDKNLRENMQFELRQLQKTLGITTVLVTHDQEEALTMADQVAVMHDGRLQQLGAPDEVYDRPRTRFVAEFLGTSNIFAAAVLSVNNDAVAARLDGAGVALDAAGDAAPGMSTQIAVRPEKITLSATELTGSNVLVGTVTAMVFRGVYRAFQVRVEPTRQVVFAYVAPQAMQPGFSVGAQVWLSWKATDAIVLKE